MDEPTEPGEYIRYEGEWVKLLSTPIFDGRWRYFTEDLSFQSTFPLEVLSIPAVGVARDD